MVIPQTGAISVLSVNLRVNACVYLSVECVCVCVCLRVWYRPCSQSVCSEAMGDSCLVLQWLSGGLSAGSGRGCWGIREGGWAHNQLPSMMCPISVVYRSRLHFCPPLSSLIETLVFKIKWHNSHRGFTKYKLTLNSLSPRQWELPLPKRQGLNHSLRCLQNIIFSDLFPYFLLLPDD